MSTLAAIMNKDPKPAMELNPAVPRELDRIINHCLRKDPARRFQHVDDLKVELEELKEESDSGRLAGAKPAMQPTQRRTWVWAGAALVFLAMATAIWIFREFTRKPAVAPEVVPLTSHAGFEEFPSFSPDGNQVAFSWNGEKQDNFDIYIKLIGSANSVRLTTDPADDVNPVFSPNGRSIGFIRMSKGHATFMIIPVIGGRESVVAEVPSLELGFFLTPSFAWFPDGKWVVTDGLTLLSTESGETRTLTSQVMKSSTNFSPAVSPDGRTVAFSRSAVYAASDVYLLDLTEDLKPKEEPRRLTSLKGLSFGSAWTPNGQEIIFSCEVSGATTDLWKVPATGTGKPEKLPFSTGQACCPAVSRSGSRLAYERLVFDANVWRLSLSRPGAATGPRARLIASTRFEEAAQFSPDGKRIAFESDRNGSRGIWVSDVDGTNAAELFSKAGSGCGTARWSPDGQRIAFGCNPEGNYDIYVIRASGGKPIRLTTDPAHDDAPSWSRDGKWVYFASKRTGRLEVWKVPATGGEAVPVTRNGGGTALESPDGKSLYYLKEDFSGPLWKTPVSGGEESQVLPFVHRRAFCFVNDGIYFIPELSPDQKSSIQFLSFATAKVKTVAPMSGFPNEGLSVSPDGHSLLYTQVDESDSDLMLVENFR